ncbi:hypothetical protein Z949_410 [Sulfitobacter guttiformis KCTC 32187]|nr:hypothetical protein Z949_410 [Sulfitobacter guttiformis KCTC 32187]
MIRVQRSHAAQRFALPSVRARKHDADRPETDHAIKLN